MCLDSISIVSIIVEAELGPFNLLKRKLILGHFE